MKRSWSEQLFLVCLISWSTMFIVAATVGVILSSTRWPEFVIGTGIIFIILTVAIIILFKKVIDESPYDEV